MKTISFFRKIMSLDEENRRVANRSEVYDRGSGATHSFPHLLNKRYKVEQRKEFKANGNSKILAEERSRRAFNERLRRASEEEA